MNEHCGQRMSEKLDQSPENEIAVAVSQSIRKHLELVGPEGTGFEKRPETNQQVRLEFDNLPLNYPPL